MQSVTADEGEESGKERAALRGRAARDHAGELADFERRGTPRPSDECDQSAEIGAGAALRTEQPSDINPQV